MNMDALIESLIGHVSDTCDTGDFEYREWFVPYHLRVVDDIAMRLCDSYPDVDRDLVRVLVWTHDYSKPLTHGKGEEKERLIPMVRTALGGLGFEDAYIARVASLLALIESKDERDLAGMPIEVRIVSSADGASHFMSPFFYSYFHTGGGNSLAEVMDAVRKKAQRDWDRKIVLPEARDLVRERYEHLMQDLADRG